MQAEGRNKGGVMTKKFLLKFVIFLFMISGMFSADLYYGNKIIINTNEKVAEIILTELKQPIDKTASADIPIIKMRWFTILNLSFIC